MADTGEDSAAEAINRALAAERRARDNVARCEQQAAARVNAARASARRVAERADARTSVLRARVEQRVARATAALRADAEKIRCQPPEQDARQTTLDAAVARLAARLTGRAP